VFGALETFAVPIRAAAVDARALIELALAIAAAIVGALGTVFYPGLLDRIVGEEQRGHPRQSIGAVMRTLPYGRLLGAEVVFIVLTTVGFLLLVVPGVVAFTVFALVGPMITIEDHGIRGAFRRSASIVRPHFWLVFFLVAVPLAVESAIVHAVEDAVHGQHIVLRFIEHGIVGAIVGSIIGLVEVHLAFALTDVHPLEEESQPSSGGSTARSAASRASS
jgi:hypothetical protein